MEQITQRPAKDWQVALVMLATGGSMTHAMAESELHVGSDVLREVAEGATVEVTKDGEVVALLVPPHRHGELRIRRATAKGAFSELPRTRVDVETQSILDDLRADR